MTKRINNAEKLTNFTTYEKDREFEENLRGLVRLAISKKMGDQEILLKFLGAVKPTDRMDITRLPMTTYYRGGCLSRVPQIEACIYALLVYTICMWWGYNQQGSTGKARFRKKADAALIRLRHVAEHPGTVLGRIDIGYWVK